MFRNYFKVAFRNLAKSKVHSFINIAGLATGMAVAILIGLWIRDEVGYNRQFENYDRIAQVIQNQTFNGEVQTWFSQPRQLGPELRNTYGGHFKYVVLSSGTYGHTLSFADKKLSRDGDYMEPDATEMLSLSMLKGSRAGLQEPGSVLLSASTAKALFGNADPMGQLMKIDNRLGVKVTGVYEDLPAASSFSKLGFIAPWALMAKADRLDERQIGWGNSWFRLYVQLADNADIAKVSAAIKDAKINKDPGGASLKPQIFLHPMSKWWLHSDFKNGMIAGGRIKNVWLFGIIGVFVLLLACINFMNLSTARSEKRAKETGIRKALGSLRGQLVSRFFTESLLVATLAFVFSLLLVSLLLPWFNEVADKKIQLPVSSPGFWLMGTAFTFITGLIAGAYPALYLSSFKPVRVLKGVFRAGPGAAIPRKVLVVVQFTVSITLIICTIVVVRQVQFAKNRPLGYTTNSLLTIPVKSADLKKHYPAFQHELINTGAVTEMTLSEATGANAYVTNSGLDWRSKPAGMQDEFITIGADHRFGKTVNWQLSQGSDFNPAITTDSFGLVLNETAVKYMGFADPIGEQVKAFGETYHIIGVVKDMIWQSPYDPVKPMLFYIDQYDRVNFILAKINPALPAAEALAKIEAVYKRYDAANPFKYEFADREYGDKFREEERIASLSGFFAALAIFISCLGLFGMASFMAEQRTKEISVRKVLGASAFNLWRLLSKEFMLLVMIALVMAIPLAYYFMHDWLQNYSYRTGMAWWIFAATGACALLITLLTVSYQSIKAALINPVKGLRTE